MYGILCCGNVHLIINNYTLEHSLSFSRYMYIKKYTVMHILLSAK